MKRICAMDYLVCCTIFILSFSVFYNVCSYININSYNVPFSLQSKIMSEFRFSPYKTEIQSTYVNELDKSELKILVKPDFWNALNDDQKNDILKIASNKWQKIFNFGNTDTSLVPKVAFANK